MPNSRASIATIDSPEFIQITKISPLISKCEIKVLYLGENRNQTFITKEVATQMAQTLPGCPIVGYYIENKEDFGDHGNQIIIDAEGVKFKKLTKPYGFVAPDAKVWFQKFEDTDEFGNKEIREYLMTEGYLWTGQYEEAKKIFEDENGRPESMELDEETLKGYWSTDNKRGLDFFIINDAIFSKLCILGEDVEPCFEGSNITAPNVSSTFSKNDNFITTLFTMVNELKETLNKGGFSMATPTTSVETDEKEVIKDFSKSQDNSDKLDNPKTEKTTEEFTKNKDQDSQDGDKKDSKEKEKENTSSKEEKENDQATDDQKDEPKEEEKDKKKVTENSLEDNVNAEFESLKSEFSKLQQEFSSLKEENEKLVKFKREVEDKEKDQLINSFTMLSDEDKKDVIVNKDKYSLHDIKAQLSIICVDKKVNFSLPNEKENNKTSEKQDVPTTYNLNNHEMDNIPAWLKAVEDVRHRNN